MPRRNSHIHINNRIPNTTIVTQDNVVDFINTIINCLEQHNNNIASTISGEQTRRFYPQQFNIEDIKRVYNLILHCNSLQSTENEERLVTKEILANIFCCDISSLNSVLVRLRKIMNFIYDEERSLLDNISFKIKRNSSTSRYFRVSNFPQFPILSTESSLDRYSRFYTKFVQIFPGQTFFHNYQQLQNVVPEPIQENQNSIRDTYRQSIINGYIDGMYTARQGASPINICACEGCMSTRRNDIRNLLDRYGNYDWVVNALTNQYTFHLDLNTNANQPISNIAIPSFFKEPFKELPASIVYVLTTA